MTLKAFVRKFRQTITNTVRREVCDDHFKMNDDDRADWVLNNESLYDLARTHRVTYDNGDRV